MSPFGELPLNYQPERTAVLFSGFLPPLYQVGFTGAVSEAGVINSAAIGLRASARTAVRLSGTKTHKPPPLGW